MEKPHTGLDDRLRMLLSCFRKKDVCSHLPSLSHFHSILLCIAYPPLLASCGRSDESPLGQCKMEAKRGFVRGGEEEEEMGEEGRRGRGRQPISHPNKVRGKGIQYSYTEGHTPCKGKARPLLSTKIIIVMGISSTDDLQLAKIMIFVDSSGHSQGWKRRR